MPPPRDDGGQGADAGADAVIALLDLPTCVIHRILAHTGRAADAVSLASASRGARACTAEVVGPAASAALPISPAPIVEASCLAAVARWDGTKRTLTKGARYGTPCVVLDAPLGASGWFFDIERVCARSCEMRVGVVAHAAGKRADEGGAEWLTWIDCAGRLLTHERGALVPRAYGTAVGQGARVRVVYSAAQRALSLGVPREQQGSAGADAFEWLGAPLELPPPPAGTQLRVAIQLDEGCGEAVRLAHTPDAGACELPARSDPPPSAAEAGGGGDGGARVIVRTLGPGSCAFCLDGLDARTCSLADVRARAAELVGCDAEQCELRAGGRVLPAQPQGTAAGGKGVAGVALLVAAPEVHPMHNGCPAANIFANVPHLIS